MPSDPSFDGPKIGETIDGQTLVAVGINDTFTEAHDRHREAFAQLNEWMSGLRLYDLEDTFELDANFWDELLDCNYEVGEGEIESEKPGEVVMVYDVWIDATAPDAALDQLCARLHELKEMAVELLPPGLHAAAQTHNSPIETLKLIAQLAD